MSSIDSRVFRAAALVSRYSYRGKKCIGSYGWRFLGADYQEPIVEDKFNFHNGVDIGNGVECTYIDIKVPKNKCTIDYEPKWNGLKSNIVGEKFYHGFCHLRQAKYIDGPSGQDGTLRLYMGNTGHSYGAHYHYSAFIANRWGVTVDPFPYLARQLNNCDICENKLTLKHNTKEHLQLFITAYKARQVWIVDQENYIGKPKC